MEVKNISVIGAGMMGNGIAQVIAQSGFKLYMRDVEDKFLENGMAKIKKNLMGRVEKGKITAEDMDAVLNNIEPITDIKKATQNADLIIEAVPENMELKKKVFQELDQLCPAHTILASNTTGLSLTEIGSATQRADKVIGMHFYNPAPIMRLIEVIRIPATSDETYTTVFELSKTLGKVPVTVNDIPGFITARVGAGVINEAFFALMEGVASAEDIDTAMKLGFNWPMGPLELADFTGLDIHLATFENLYREFGDPKFRPCPLLRKYVRAGWLGVKTKRGVYKYD